MQKDANLVELDKCCETHIFLQIFVLIQPRTSPVNASFSAASGRALLPLTSGGGEVLALDPLELPLLDALLLLRLLGLQVPSLSPAMAFRWARFQKQ